MAENLDSDVAESSDVKPKRTRAKKVSNTSDTEAKAAAPKRRGRPATKKKSTEDAYALLAEAQKDIVPITKSEPNLDTMLGLEALGLPSVPEALEKSEEKPKRRPGRPRKSEKTEPKAEEKAEGTSEEKEAPKRRRSVRKKVEQTPDEQPHLALDLEAKAETEAAEEAPKPRRRTRKKATEVAATPEEQSQEDTAQKETDSSASSEGSEQKEASAAEAEEPPVRTRRRRTTKSKDEDAQAEANSEQTTSEEEVESSADKTHDKGNRESKSSKFDRNIRRNNKSRKNTNEPSVTYESLSELEEEDIRAQAKELELDDSLEDLDQLKHLIADKVFEMEGFRRAEGILDIQKDGYSYLRSGNYGQGDSDSFVHSTIIRNYALRPGDHVVGICAPAKAGNKFPPLAKIEKINGIDPELARLRPRFKDLTPIYPDERLVMENGKDSTTGRAIDLVAPIGKGQRGLIVSPPKAGKTTVLKHICQSIAANNPEVHLFCLLVDERPEEVTDMERSVKGTVVASTFDQPAQNHTAVAELVIERAKRLVEMGEDVVVILDSITRLARAYNLACPASGRILSGGVDSAALYPPKKFLGAARNIEGGGSLTILASALVDTGSKMDEVIFEEFKGTGNMELKLDRDLADRRIFPAIDPVQSGTRNEDLLIDAELQPFVWGMRRILANMNSTERAATALVKGLKGTNNNSEFLIRTAKKAAQQEFVATL